MSKLLPIILLILVFCKDPQIKTIETKFEDRSNKIEEIEKKASAVKDSPDVILVKDQLAISLEELRKTNSEIKSCSIANARLETKVGELEKRLEEAEFALGFYAAFKWGFISLCILVFVWALSKLKILNIPFLG
jgi:hypothetical protein